MFKRGFVVLIPFPFTDLSSEKLRPAVIVSDKNEDRDDVIVAFITSNTSRKTPSSFVVKDTSRFFEDTGLKVNSCVRLDRLATLDKKTVLGEIGEFADELMTQVNQGLRETLGLT